MFDTTLNDSTPLIQPNELHLGAWYAGFMADCFKEDGTLQPYAHLEVRAYFKEGWAWSLERNPHGEIGIHSGAMEHDKFIPVKRLIYVS